MSFAKETTKEITSDGWKNWQVALAIAIPVATIGAAGIYVYRRRKNKKSVDKTLSNSNSDKQEHQSDYQRAQAAKRRGNKFFSDAQYDKSIECYSEAIQICPSEYKEEHSTFYQNRAAAYEQLKKYDKVIEDCTQALSFNKKYTKALNRRAKAYEQKNNLSNALEDITAVCILENFANQTSLIMADRILKQLGQKLAKEKYAERKLFYPSPHFIRTYFSSFTKDPIFNKVEGKPVSINSQMNGHSDEKDLREGMEKDSSIETPYDLALLAFKKEKYEEIVGLCEEEVNAANSTHKNEAQLLRATFLMLHGENEEAAKLFHDLLSTDDIDKYVRCNVLIKLASMLMTEEKNEEAMVKFDEAVKVDAFNPDNFHHRGQLHLINGNMEMSISDFNRALAINDEIPIIHVQKCFANLRLASGNYDYLQIQKTTEDFDAILKRFPDCVEGFTLYGQSLVELKKFEKADECYKKALKLEPDNSNLYVHRAMLMLTWKENIEEAEKLIEKAIEVDPTSGFAYQTLGNIEFQRGDIDKANELFQKAIDLSKNEMEFVNLYQLLHAALAQKKAAEQLGITLPSML